LGFLVLNSGCERAHELFVSEVVREVRELIGPVAAFKTAAVVESLPKTRSGKILRASMGAIADSVEYRAPATIEDPAVLDEIEIALQGVGYAQK
jgi:propionyl-CoA synthetase